MNESKNTKKALHASLVSLFLCIVMLIGTTFAWFTDSASTGINKIQAGNLKVDIVDAEDGTTSLANQELKFETADGREDILWEPGCTYKLPAFKIANKGNLWLKYKVELAGVTGAAELLNVIDFYVFDDEATETQIKAAISNGTATSLKDYFTLTGEDATANGIPLAPESLSDAMVLVGHMQENAGNTYMNKELAGISITVLATQYMEEKDSFDDQYDNGAEYPYIDNQNGTFTKPGDNKLYVQAADKYIAVEPYEGVDGLYLDQDGDAYAATRDAMVAVALSSYDLPNGYEDTNLTLIQDISIAPHQNSSHDGYLFLNDSVFDLNGNTLTVETNNQFMVVGKNITIKNGTIKAGSDNIAYPVAATDRSQNVVFEDIVCVGGIQVLGNSKVSLKNVTSTATSFYNVYLAGGSATVTVESGTYTDNGKAHFYIQDEKCQAIVNGGTFSGGTPTSIGNGTLTDNR